MKDEQKIIEYLLKTENPYQLKVGNMNVEIIYSENGKKFTKCVLNILKQRLK